MSLSLILLGFSCGNHDAHDHTEAHGHGHGHPDDAEQVTVWTDTLEAFVEYDPLQANQDSRMLVHLTWLEGHRPVTEGALTVHLEGNGVHDTVSLSAPSRTGIFIPTFKPSAVDNAQLWLELNSEGRSERVDLAIVSVSAATEHSHGGHGHAHAEASSETMISFLKEQAWKIPFQTHPATEQAIYQSIEALGQWTVRPEDWVTVVAPASGTVSFGREVPHLGAALEANVHTMTIQTEQLFEGSLALRWQEVQIAWDTVRAEYDRNKPLMESGVLSPAQWEVIEHRYLTTKAQFEGLSRQTSNGHSRIVNPASGHIAEIFVEQGAYVRQGDPLYKIVTQVPALLQLSIPHRHHDALKHIQSAEVQIDGEWRRLDNARIHVGLSLGEHHTIPIQVFTEPQDHVVAEEKTPVRIVFGDPEPQLAIPQSALLEEYGQYSVIVQLSGEEFALRPVSVGDRNGEWVAITAGLAAGDWVVSTGNYRVKLASESGGLPAHGHAH